AQELLVEIRGRHLLAVLERQGDARLGQQLALGDNPLVDHRDDPISERPWHAHGRRHHNDGDHAASSSRLFTSSTRPAPVFAEQTIAASFGTPSCASIDRTTFPSRFFGTRSVLVTATSSGRPALVIHCTIA